MNLHKCFHYLLFALLCPAAQAQLAPAANMTPEQQARLRNIQAQEQQAQQQQIAMQIAQAATPEQHMQVARNAIIRQRDALQQLALLLGQINSPYTANRKASSVQVLSHAYLQAYHIELGELNQLPFASRSEVESMYQEQISALLLRVRQQVEMLSGVEHYYGSALLKNATIFFLR